MRNNFEAEVIQTIQYFSFFSYPPNFEEIHTFLKKKVSKKGLASILGKMEKKGVIVNKKNPHLYTLPQYSNYFRNRLVRRQISKRKIQRIQFFLRIISWFPQIQLIGLSGTVAMMNAEEKDDIDLFVITAKNRLFTARMIALLFAHIMGIRRKRLTYLQRPSRIGYKDKVCLNLFFDESNLRVPRFKQTEYVAHEVLQMKPMINKNFTYERFLNKNQWVYRIFPNAKKPNIQKKPKNNPNFLGNVIEFFLKKLELTIIKQHQTNEIITDSQLWFHPEDFGKKIIENKLQ